MKKTYMPPVMIAEEFNPSESVASGCNRAPGADPEPQAVQCYYYVRRDNCSNKNTSVTVFMQGNTGCNVQATTDGNVVPTGNIHAAKHDFVDDGPLTSTFISDLVHRNHFSDAYYWPNGSGGNHWIKAGEISAVNGVGEIVTYFNS